MPAERTDKITVLEMLIRLANEIKQLKIRVKALEILNESQGHLRER